MTITWGDKAYDDLDRIAHYLANLSPEAAEKTISRIQNAVAPASHTITTHGNSCPWLPPATVARTETGKEMATGEPAAGIVAVRSAGIVASPERRIKLHVTSGAATIAASATQARM